MPAWIAGIQVRKDASGNIHVNLYSSTPYWNDANGGFCLKPTCVSLIRIFKEEHRGKDREKDYFEKIGTSLSSSVNSVRSVVNDPNSLAVALRRGVR
jgi:hypothetical protein